MYQIDYVPFQVLTKPIELSRVIHLIEDPLTLLKELADIFKILNLVAEKSKDHPEYTSHLCIIFLFRLPFLKEKTSDEVNYAQSVKESISQLGFLMRVPDAEVRNQICHSIISFYRSETPKHSVGGLHATSPGYRVQLLEQSGLAETLVLSMALLEHQHAVKLQVLHTLQILSSSSDVNCSLMLKAQGAQQVCFHMNEPDPSGQILFRSSEIIWNLLERGSKEEVITQLSNLDCIITQLAEVFSLLNAVRHYDLQLRNDLLVIITLIAEYSKSPLIERFLGKQLILYITFPELKSHNPLVRNLKLSYNNEDFEMKTLLLNLVVVMSKDLSALQLFKEGRVVLALLHLVKPTAALPPGQSGPGSWTSVQQEALQLQALATLATLAPLMVEDYMTCQGNTSLLLLLEWCTEQDSYFGQGHSFHGTGGRGSKKAQMRYCVRLLRSMTSLGNKAINQDLFDQGAISQLLGIIMQMDGTPEEEDVFTLEIMVDIQLILSALCENNQHRKELFGAEGVKMAVHFLKMSPEKFNSGLGHNKLILSTVDCVWSCIVGCYTTEDMFLEKEGAFLLLDLLNVCFFFFFNKPPLIKLDELCDNPKTMSHVMAWKGPNSVTTPALLLQLWRQEEAEMGVRRDPYGRIADPKKPILCYYQEDDDALVSLSADRPSASIMDVSENLRSKIYSVFCKLGFESLSGLSTEDYITLSIVTRYLDFKVGEVWDEITRELSQEEVRPVTPDKEALGAIAKLTEDTARRVIAEQSSMLEEQEKEDANEEKHMYTEISSYWKQQELTAQSWENFVAKTSNYKILKETKQRQENSINMSRPKPKHGEAIFHPTQIPGLQTTTFCGRVLTVESTPAKLTGGPLANTELALERVPIHGGALSKPPPVTQDPEYFKIVSVK
uniref:Cilia- and flagella-associated protein 69 ARM repeats domain-containing protein n=1 Tax=Esox lucius TaxID=8010 RepID=A0A6Q2ZET9_ESOLU